MKLRIFALLFIALPIASQAQLGGKEPAGDNKTKAGKAQNRRVDFIKV